LSKHLKGCFIKSTKTERSTRVVILPEKAILKLKELQEEQEREGLELGTQWADNGYVFTQINGERMFPGTISRWFGKWIATTDLPDITFHGLRHSNASLLIAQDEDIATISAWLGHSNITTTLNVYGHADKENKKEVAKKLNRIL